MGMPERIKERRKEMGYTQTELGKKLGLQASAIAKYENGRVENMKRSVIAKMAKVLECSPTYLMGLEDNLTQENADLIPDILSDGVLTDHVKKLMDLNQDHKNTIYDNIDYWYEKEGH